MSTPNPTHHRIQFRDPGSAVVSKGGRPRLNTPAEERTNIAPPTTEVESDENLVADSTRKTVADKPATTEEINRAFKSENPDHYQVIRKLRFGETVIDPVIQRPEQTSEINTIARNFSPPALNVPTASCRIDENGNETYVVLDGQQRRAAALKIGYEELVPFVIHYGLSLKEEAWLFLNLNYRRSVSAAVRFKNELVGEDPVALAIKAVCDGLGIEIGVPSGLMAVDLAKRLANSRDGLRHFRWALEEIQTIFDPERKGGVYNNQVIEAFTRFHRHYEGKMDVKRLEKKLSEVGTVWQLIGRGQNVKSFRGGRISDCLIDVLVERYNHHMGTRSAKALPEFPRRKGRQVAEA
jgi:hypothetical protein